MRRISTHPFTAPTHISTYINTVSSVETLYLRSLQSFYLHQSWTKAYDPTVNIAPRRNHSDTSLSPATVPNVDSPETLQVFPTFPIRNKKKTDDASARTVYAIKKYPNRATIISATFQAGIQARLDTGALCSSARLTIPSYRTFDWSVKYWTFSFHLCLVRRFPSRREHKNAPAT